MPSLFLAQSVADVADVVNTTGQSVIPEDIRTAAAAAISAGGLLVGGMLIFWIIFGLIQLIFFIWWIILLIDLLNRDFEQKTNYIIIMIIGLITGFVWLVDIIYYFAVVKTNLGKKS